MELLGIGGAMLLFVAVLHQWEKRRGCGQHQLIWATDAVRGRHLKCLECPYRSNGLLAWSRRDRILGWLERRATAARARKAA